MQFYTHDQMHVHIPRHADKDTCRSNHMLICEHKGTIICTHNLWTYTRLHVYTYIQTQILMLQLVAYYNMNTCANLELMYQVLATVLKLPYKQDFTFLYGNCIGCQKQGNIYFKNHIISLQ